MIKQKDRNQAIASRTTVSKPRRRFQDHIFPPMTMTWADVAFAVFRVSESWLRDHLSEFPDFPKADTRLDVFATEAVEQWVRRRFGLVQPDITPQDAEQILIDRATASHAQHPRPVSRRSAA